MRGALHAWLLPGGLIARVPTQWSLCNTPLIARPLGPSRDGQGLGARVPGRCGVVGRVASEEARQLGLPFGVPLIGASSELGSWGYPPGCHRLGPALALPPSLAVGAGWSVRHQQSVRLWAHAQSPGGRSFVGTFVWTVTRGWFLRVFGIFLRLGHATGRAKCAGPATPERVVCTELFLLSLTQPNDIGDGSQLFILGRASHRSMRRQATLSSRTGRVFLSLGYNPLQRRFFALDMATF